MSTRMSLSHLFVGALAGLFIMPGCAGNGDDDFLQCVGKCDSAGPMQVSTRWVPVGGSVRAVLGEEYGLTVEPSSQTSVDDSSGRHRLVRFDKPGFYKLKASKDGSGVAELGVRVSNEGPSFVIDGPSVHRFVDSGSESRVRVHGTIQDALGEALTAKIGDERMQLGSDGSFDVTVNADWGINMVDLTAVDAVGNEFLFTRAFMAADNFADGPTALALRLDNTSINLLNSRISEIFPSIIDFGETNVLLEDNLLYDVYFDGATMPGQNGNPGTFAFDLEARAGRLHTIIASDGLTLGYGHTDDVLADFRAFESRMTNARWEFDIFFEKSGDGVSARADNVDVTFDDFRFDIQGIPPWLESLFEGYIVKKIEKNAETVIAPQIDKILHALEGNLDLPLDLLELEVPLALQYSISDISAESGSLAFQVVGQVDGLGGTPDAPGPPRRSEANVSAPAGSPVASSISYNTLNQFLFKIWRSGSLRMTLTEADIPLDTIPGISALHPTIDAKVELLLPPVVEPDNGVLIFSAGEARADITVATDLFQFAVEANIGLRGELGIEIKENSIKVSPTLRELHVDIGRRAFDGLNTEAVEEMVKQMAPELTAQLSKRIEEFPMPKFDLAQAGLPSMLLGIEGGTVEFGADAAIVRGDLVPVF